MSQGFAYIAGAMSNDLILQAFGGVAMKGGFVAEECERLVKEKTQNGIPAKN